jgi:hypothetical protein
MSDLTPEQVGLHQKEQHVIPLCKGGADTTWNLQWQSVEDSKVKDSKVKDRWECSTR